MEMRCNQLKVSVIVPVYKAEPFIRHCVDSILAQNYPNLEVILVDDGSPDNCPLICDEYGNLDGRVRVIHKENGGASSARNAALDVATGEYITFVDSDDYIDPDFISELIKHKADVVVSGQSAIAGFCQIQNVKKNFYTWGGFAGPCEKLYRREKINSIRFRKDLPIGEDLIFNLEVLKYIDNVKYIPYKGYHIVDNPGSLTRSNAKKYSAALDEEWQNKWGMIQASALLEAGISQDMTDAKNRDGCSVWIYQKIKNYCYSDCPHSYAERISRIRRQLEGNREVILSVEKPSSPKTYAIIKLCTILKSPHITYWVFKVLVALGF